VISSIVFASLEAPPLSNAHKVAATLHAYYALLDVRSCLTSGGDRTERFGASAWIITMWIKLHSLLVCRPVRVGKITVIRFIVARGQTITYVYLFWHRDSDIRLFTFIDSNV